MNDAHYISLKQLYSKIKTFIEAETENEMDDLRNMFYDIMYYILY